MVSRCTHSQIASVPAVRCTRSSNPPASSTTPALAWQALYMTVFAGPHGASVLTARSNAINRMSCQRDFIVLATSAAWPSVCPSWMASFIARIESRYISSPSPATATTEATMATSTVVNAYPFPIKSTGDPGFRRQIVSTGTGCPGTQLPAAAVSTKRRKEESQDS